MQDWINFIIYGQLTALIGPMNATAKANIVTAVMDLFCSLKLFCLSLDKERSIFALTNCSSGVDNHTRKRVEIATCHCHDAAHPCSTDLDYIITHRKRN